MKRSAKSKSEALKLLRALIAEQTQGRLIAGPQMTLSAFAEFWLTNEAGEQVRDTTASTYAFLLRRYVEPALGHRKLTSITSTEIAQWLASLRDGGYSTNTIKRARGVAHLLFEHAARHELVSDNPVKRVKPPRRSPDEPSQVRDPLTLEEAQKLLQVSVGTNLEAFIHLCLFLGLRRGEALGLRWSDIDFDAETLQISQTLKEGTKVLPDGTGVTRPVVNPPKTRNSARTLSLPAPVIKILKTHRRRQNEMRLHAGSAWQETDYVFTNEAGGALWPSAVYKKFGGLIKRTGLRYVRIHDLRHTTAHLMLEAGARLEEVSQALGHASITITKDVYAGYVQSLSNEATSVLATALTGENAPDMLGVAVGLERSRVSAIKYTRPASWRGDA